MNFVKYPELNEWKRCKSDLLIKIIKTINVTRGCSYTSPRCTSGLISEVSVKYRIPWRTKQLRVRNERARRTAWSHILALLWRILWQQSGNALWQLCYISIFYFTFFSYSVRTSRLGFQVTSPADDINCTRTWQILAHVLLLLNL